jgi:hypothetical protein
LENQIFQQTTDIVVGKRRANSRPQAKAAAKPAGDIILSAPFPDLEFARTTDAAIAGVKAQHNFAQSEQVESARVGRLNVHNEKGYGLSISTADAADGF